MPIPCCRYALGSHTAKDMQHQLHPECFAGGAPLVPSSPPQSGRHDPLRLRREIHSERNNRTKKTGNKILTRRLPCRQDWQIFVGSR